MDCAVGVCAERRADDAFFGYESFDEFCRGDVECRVECLRVLGGNSAAGNRCDLVGRTFFDSDAFAGGAVRVKGRARSGYIERLAVPAGKDCLCSVTPADSLPRRVTRNRAGREI